MKTLLFWLLKVFPFLFLGFLCLVHLADHSNQDSAALRLQQRAIALEANAQQEQARLRLQKLVDDHIDYLSQKIFDAQGQARFSSNQQVSDELTSRTLAFLRVPNLDGEHKAQVLLFLHQVAQINLPDADLRDLQMIGVNLRNANLQGADLSQANLVRTNLSGANLESADLGGANLSDSVLSNVNLSNANLSSANLRGTNFIGVNLHAANLSDADITGVTNLHAASLCKTQLPHSSVLNPNRDCIHRAIHNSALT